MPQLRQMMRMFSSSSSSRLLQNHYLPHHHLLFVGEGDFGLSTDVSRQFGAGNCSRILATSLHDTAYLLKNHTRAKHNIDLLTKRGAMVLLNVNARKLNLDSRLSWRAFDRIVFFQPHIRPILADHERMQIERNRQFLMQFFHSASRLLNHDGQIHIKMKFSQVYSNWNIQEIAALTNLKLIQEYDFDGDEFPGYRAVRGEGKRPDGLVPGEMKIYKFVHADDFQQKVMSSSFDD